MIENRVTQEPVGACLRCHQTLAWPLRSIALALLAGCGVSFAAEPVEFSQQASQGLNLTGLISSSSEFFREAPVPRLRTETTGPIAMLLPPQPVESAKQVAVAELIQTPQQFAAADAVLQPAPPASSSLSEQERLLVEQVIRDCSEASAGVLTDARVEVLAGSKIRRANELANRGAHYAARGKLIEALRVISQAKDAQQGDRQFSSALAAGLRALDEAEDFAPRGTQLEGELELGLITAAHRTPLANQSDPDKMLPQQMIDRYFRYAQLKLGMSVKDEPTGSMALCALGKVTSQMGRMEPLRHRLAHRRAVAFQQAALLSHNHNHMAAHELAVLLAESGQLAESQELLLRVSTHRPNATVYANLAQVQQRMGLIEESKIGHALAMQLGHQESGGIGPIRWISPEEFNRTGDESIRSVPPSGAGQSPLTRRPRYNQRTALASSPLRSSRPIPSQRSMPRPTNSTPNWR